MDAAIPIKPTAVPSTLSQPYWDGALRGQLMLQRCSVCGTVRHYPRLLCSSCWATSLEWIQAEITGRIHSWTVAHHAYHPAFVDELPYVLVTVDLKDGVRVLGRYRGDSPALGLSVIGRFDIDGDRADLVFDNL